MSKNLQEYWKKNLSIMTILLSIWAVVSYGCGILFVKPLCVNVSGTPTPCEISVGRVGGFIL